MARNRYQHVIDAMTVRDIAEIRQMIVDGYGARGISLNSPYSLIQANAVFYMMRQG